MVAKPAVHSLLVDHAHTGQRLDQFLRSALPELSRATLRELIARAAVRVNGRPASKGSRVTAGDRVEVSAALESGPAPDPDVPLRVLYEDRWLVALDKPGGIPSHALRPGERGTIVSGLIARYPELQGVGYRALEPGLLHRLDNDTSGVLLVARDQVTFETLRAAHLRGEFRKRYQALVAGSLAPGQYHAYLRADRRTVVVRDEPFESAKPIHTECMTSEPHGAWTLVSVQVALAARHQVRAHLAQLGHAIAGDAQYGGGALPGLTRHFLHASELELSHPEDGRKLCFSAALPDDLQRVLIP